MKNGGVKDDMLWRKMDNTFKGFDDTVPYIFSEPKIADEYPMYEAKELLEAVKEVRVEDDYIDHSKSSLNNEELFEIEVFKQMKKDPYFKHHIENAVREGADKFNEIHSNLFSLYSGKSIKDVKKWDPTEYPLMSKSTYKQKDLLIDGMAVGAGKRKSS